jgi:predicted PhzF superfamily epimerase YddE/YHI9
MLFLDFPTDSLKSLPAAQYNVIEQCIGMKPIEAFTGKSDYLAVIDTESSLRNLQPNLNAIANINARGLIVTAKGDTADFVSRFFAPQLGINEDPVTGSAHTTLLPYWSNKLCKNKFVAKQLSQRGGQLFCEFKNDRSIIGGKARLYLTGEINLE